MWQRHQEIMSRFARAGYRVVLCEPIGIRIPNWQDRHRILARLRNRRQAGTRGVREVMPNVWVVDPLIIPFQNIAFLHQRNVSSLTRQLQNAMQQVGGGTPILWTYVPTPLALDVIERIPHELLVYDCVDALTLSPKGVFQAYAASEETLSRRADAVFVSSPKLYERQRPLNRHTYLITHGVEYDLFAKPRPQIPSALAAIPAPRLVLFGGIDERIDLELLDHLAARHPEWNIVLLGLVRTDVSHLKQRPNVHFLGLVPHDELPAYLHQCDVILLPYRMIDFTQYIYPAKLFECLAVGKPTIAAPIPSLLEFSHVLSIARTPDEFERAIQDALHEENDAEQIAARRGVARANAWSSRFEEMIERMNSVRCAAPH